MQTKEITELFKQKGIKATAQRIAVYKYLYENRIHPDVDTVYKNMVKDNPSFSKTTVYNCLQALTDSGLIIPVVIESEKIRYDANLIFIRILNADAAEEYLISLAKSAMLRALTVLISSAEMYITAEFAKAVKEKQKTKIILI